MNHALKIATAVSRAVALRGGSSTHVLASTVTLPSSIFDDLMTEARREAEADRSMASIAGGPGVDEFSVLGVTFRRGATDEQVRALAAARNGS